MKDKHHPIRSCIVCGKKDYKSNLLRIACFKQKIGLDSEQQLPGRGAYVCLEGDCIKKMTIIKYVRKLERALRQHLTFDVIEDLKKQIEGVLRRG
ncbi:MAG: YlxR family protein [Candidatus Desulfofervidaceae bacterium]|nr:YlxR family protein [Candidatus Desulfofervidaceae bacterium]